MVFFLFLLMSLMFFSSRGNVISFCWAAWAPQKSQRCKFQTSKWFLCCMGFAEMSVNGLSHETSNDEGFWNFEWALSCFVVESWWDGEGFLKKCSTSWSNFSLATPFAPKGKSVGISKVSVFWKLFLSENITQYLWVCRATQQTLAVDRSFRQRWFPEKRFSKEDDNCFAINGKEWEKWTSDQSV